MSELGQSERYPVPPSKVPLGTGLCAEKKGSSTGTLYRTWFLDTITTARSALSLFISGSASISVDKLSHLSDRKSRATLERLVNRHPYKNK